MGHPVIQVDNVSKRFCRNMRRSMMYGIRDILSDVVGRRPSAAELRADEFWAVDDVSVTVEQGQCLGLIGANGAGKSTLLKMLNGIIRPDRGRIAVRGRVGALIEVGAGFHPLLTGRENVFVNGAILGMSRQEIASQFDAIVAFAELESFIDTPVKFYSSGMYVRLGFAVAAHLRPEILLVDEVLAVGDMAFQAKCLQHVSQLCADGCSVILVSHNEEMVRRVCRNGLTLEAGRPVCVGDIHDCYADYNRRPRGFLRDTQRAGNGRVRITHAEFLDGEGRPTTNFHLESPMTIRVHVEPQEPVDDLVLDLGFNSPRGIVAASAHTAHSGFRLGRIAEPTVVEFRFESLTLAPGLYRITAMATGSDLLNIYDWRRNAWEIHVENDFYVRGASWMPFKCEVQPDASRAEGR
jgi:lipopolysaccharide transport system ATP-binding protein